MIIFSAIEAETIEQREGRNEKRHGMCQNENATPNFETDVPKLIVRPPLKFADLPVLSKNMRTRINNKRRKFDLLLEDLTNNHVLGKVIGFAYTIETTDPVGYDAISKYMVHGPCGSYNQNYGCMMDGKCTKYYPKDFRTETTIDSNGYPVYRRRDDKRIIQLKDIEIDNMFIVPYNRGLIVKYQAHINIEWCNQGLLINYMFKYVAKVWKPRKNNIRVIGYLVYVHPTAGERFYLRMLLNIVCGATSFDDIRTVNGVVYKTYKEACFHHGLLDSDDEWHEAIRDTYIHQSGAQLRELFMTLLLFCDVSDLRALWNNHWKSFSDDIELQQRRLSRMQNFIISDQQLECFTLHDVELQLRKRGKTLKDFSTLPKLDHQLQ
ncbi:hypothetical protein POM88_042490 [Heracleum sosnowskyi]|uniref:Helitron helicase-like domain-containing protein n=1 Tax=Heracleum sosnowskyi TaxID=360622 RepID=A0AAD8HIE5_9APIA|nr:hypothetical protein POM88_042490 [Heracleum sosnowskyi]